MPHATPFQRLHRLVTRTSIVALVYTAVAVAMTWPLAIQLGSRLASDLGDPAFNAWVIGWGAGQMLAALRGDAGALSNYWNGNIFYPEPLTLTYSEHLTAQAMQALPIYAVTGNILTAYNLIFISTFVGSSLAVFLLVRDLTGRPLAGFLAGLAFAYAPYRLGQFPHIQTLSAYWMPFALVGLHRYFTRLTSAVSGMRLIRPLAGASGAIVAQNLSCGYYMLFFAPFAAAYVLYEIVQRRLVANWRMWMHLALAAAFVAAVTWPFVAPYLRLRELGGLGVRPLSEIVMFSADTHAFATAASRTRWLSDWLPGYIKPEGEGFPGFTILFFAAVGLAWGIRGAVRDLRWSALRDWHAVAVAVMTLTVLVSSAVVLLFFVNGHFSLTAGGRTMVYQRATVALVVAGASLVALLAVSALARRGRSGPSPAAVGFFAVALLAAALLALGPRIEAAGKNLGPGPYLWLLSLPGFDGLRVPARMLMLVSLFLSVIAGLGVAALAKLRWRSIARVAVVVGTAGILVEGCITPFETNLPVKPGPGLVAPPDPRSGAEVNPIYELIRTLPERVVLLELPFGDNAYDILAVFHAAHHRRPLVNGYSGFFPPRYGPRVSVLRDVPNDPDRASAVLGGSGATHVLLHQAAFAGDRGAAVAEWLRAIGARPVTSAGSDTLFALNLAPK